MASIFDEITGHSDQPEPAQDLSHEPESDEGSETGIVEGESDTRTEKRLRESAQELLRLGLLEESARPNLYRVAITNLAGLNAVCALLCFALPERDPHPALAAMTEALLDRMEAGEDWAEDYLHW